MQAEYDITFTRQFGEMDDAEFTPPTSSNYNKVSTLLSTCTNTVSTIPITIFHDVSVQQMARSSEQSSNSGSNTRSASRMDGIISKMTPCHGLEFYIKIIAHSKIKKKLKNHFGKK